MMIQFLIGMSLRRQFQCLRWCRWFLWLRLFQWLLEIRSIHFHCKLQTQTVQKFQKFQRLHKFHSVGLQCFQLGRCWWWQLFQQVLFQYFQLQILKWLHSWVVEHCWKRHIWMKMMRSIVRKPSLIRFLEVQLLKWLLKMCPYIVSVGVQQFEVEIQVLGFLS
jgi:hypothetical protein